MAATMIPAVPARRGRRMRADFLRVGHDEMVSQGLISNVERSEISLLLFTTSLTGLLSSSFI